MVVIVFLVRVYLLGCIALGGECSPPGQVRYEFNETKGRQGQEIEKERVYSHGSDPLFQTQAVLLLLSARAGPC